MNIPSNVLNSPWLSDDTTHHHPQEKSSSGSLDHPFQYFDELTSQPLDACHTSSSIVDRSNPDISQYQLRDFDLSTYPTEWGLPPSAKPEISAQSKGMEFDDVDSLSDLSTEKSEGEFSGDETVTSEGKKKQKIGHKPVEHIAKAKNREHAKNTRIRKKNYIEALKETVKKHADEREKVDRGRRICLSRLAEQTNVRKQVLQTMFYFRATAEMSHAKWKTILDDNFTLIMPITPYRSFPPTQVKNGQRHIKGIEGMLADTASLSVLVQSIGSFRDDRTMVHVQYYSEPTEGIMNGDTYMSKWLMRTENATSRGARQEVYKHGMIKAVFSPASKLLLVELAFDVMSFMQLLRRSTGRYDFQVIPNTLALALEGTHEPRVVTESAEPYRIVHVNKSWCDMMNFSTDEVVGRPLPQLFGMPVSLSPNGLGAAIPLSPPTGRNEADWEWEMNKFNELLRNIRAFRADCAVVTQYSNFGVPLRTLMRVFPLFSDGVPTHRLTTFEIFLRTPRLSGDASSKPRPGGSIGQLSAPSPSSSSMMSSISPFPSAPSSSAAASSGSTGNLPLGGMTSLSAHAGPRILSSGQGQGGGYQVQGSIHAAFLQTQRMFPLHGDSMATHMKQPDWPAYIKPDPTGVGTSMTKLTEFEQSKWSRGIGGGGGAGVVMTSSSSGDVDDESAALLSMQCDGAMSVQKGEAGMEDEGRAQAGAAKSAGGGWEALEVGDEAERIPLWFRQGLGIPSSHEPPVVKTLEVLQDLDVAPAKAEADLEVEAVYFADMASMDLLKSMGKVDGHRSQFPL